MLTGIQWLYSEKIKGHFINPQNILEDGDEKNFHGCGLVGNIKCGDQMLMCIKVKNDIITDCRWKTYGCASAIASTSILSEMVKGMTLDEAYNIKPKKIAQELGGLPENKIHCSVLGDKALRRAIDDYFIQIGQEYRVKKEKAKIVCQCMNVTDKDIEQAVKDGTRNYQELQNKTKIGTVCGQCKSETQRLLDEFIHLYG